MQEYVGASADGMPGAQTLARVAMAMNCLELWSAVQVRAGVKADGVPGELTARGVARVLNIPLPVGWPTQAEVRSGKSMFGRAGDEGVLVPVVPAYQLYFDGRPVKTIRVHRLVADAVKAAFADVLAHYGVEEIKRLRLDEYGGSFNDRSTAGGKSKSMHAWGIALDFDPEMNGYSCHAPHAGLSRSECKKFWEIWEGYGAVSLGRERDYDWMHLQFARF